MDFMLWAVRASHLFAVIVWLGILLYNGAVVLPIWLSGDPVQKEVSLTILRKSAPLLWTGLTTVLVTGLCLMLFSTRFVFLSYHDWWSVALGLKQVSFLLMAFVTVGLIRLTGRFHHLIASGEIEAEEPLKGRVARFNRLGVLFGIVALMLAASMS